MARGLQFCHSADTSTPVTEDWLFEFKAMFDSTDALAPPLHAYSDAAQRAFDQLTVSLYVARPSLR